MDTQIELKSINVDGTVLHYMEQGSGEPLVLVHGGLSDYRSWRMQIEAFSAQYRVIVYSRRYHYPNAWQEDGPEYTVELHAADLARLLRALDLDSVRLVGHSYGAFTSLVMTLHHPELVNHLVLAEPPILLWLKRLPDGSKIFTKFLKETMEASNRAFDNGDMVEGVRTFLNGVGGVGAYDHIPPTARAIQMDNARVLQAEMKSGVKYGYHPGYFADPSCAELGNLRIPTLLVRGERSPVMFHMVLDELAKCLPQAQQVKIPDVSHSIPAGNPPVFNAAVLDFLKAR